jgi:hypothetical protein
LARRFPRECEVIPGWRPGRAVYTVFIGDAIYVVDAFQKKSKSGIATPTFHFTPLLQMGHGRRQLPERTIPEKIVDDTIILKRPRRGAKLREEVWQTGMAKWQR